jgi:DNA-directed RNA polymerase subunit RPC12/RpoP
MALIKCSECGEHVSDKAAVCMRCGAPVVAQQAQAIPVVVRKEPSTKWWLWIPLGLGGAFLLFGALIPKNVADANAFRRTCDEFVKAGAATRLDCDRKEAEIRYRDEPGKGATTITPEIAAALRDGDAKRREPSKPTSWPTPPANLFEGQPPPPKK